MHTVKSKYKNPDRLIAKLKRNADAKEFSKKYWQKEFYGKCDEVTELKKSVLGIRWFKYAEGETKSVSFNDTGTSEPAKLGDTVFMQGKIIKLVHSSEPKESGAKFEIGDVYLKK